MLNHPADAFGFLFVAPQWPYHYTIQPRSSPQLLCQLPPQLKHKLQLQYPSTPRCALARAFIHTVPMGWAV